AMLELPEARHAWPFGAWSGARHRAIWAAKSQILVLLGNEAAKRNCNPIRNNEGLIYYYKIPFRNMI
ncbi:hypothetical protein HAX54_051509, partial [Datura stramonium]|nr:hypothetical protein [Datura stramonium]